MNPLIQLKKINPLFVITLALLCLGLLPRAEAVSPPPDGDYGNANTAEGHDALENLDVDVAVGNTGLGAAALFNTTTASNNTATGVDALALNMIGNDNTATGAKALFNNTGSGNTATGFLALFKNTGSVNNTAMGNQALYGNMSGNFNTATGAAALKLNTSGSDNTATGYFALMFNNGSSNTAYGSGALFDNTTGSMNIALGFQAGLDITGSNNIDIGNFGATGENNTIRIGTSQMNAFMAGIFNASTTNGVAVFVEPSGHLGTVPSSKRFKEEIKPMEKASEAILALKPVTFRYKKAIDPAGRSQFGLVAEDVEKVNAELVVHDKEGKPYSVRYDQVNAMLLNEFLKEHRKVEQMQQQIDALTAGLQKVSAQLEVSKPTPQVADSNH